MATNTTPSPAAREAAKELSKNNWLADRTSATEEFVAYIIGQSLAGEREAAGKLAEALVGYRQGECFCDQSKGKCVDCVASEALAEWRRVTGK